MITSVEKTYDILTQKFSGYKIVKDEKTSHVPLNEENTDYKEIQEWIADGGTVIDNGGSE
ncbi:hypothetical protein [uncultured Mediterranean phage uvMED]|nr:hypothetical protein [uncultured Mediterranean phage uvMED]|tara:strand:+ start:336 stop:515 length:180 start_codon:yes stop_codon:yes gene_type:complete